MRRAPAAPRPEALNHAVRGILPERMRLHVCRGNYEAPHDRDVPLRDILDIVQRLLNYASVIGPERVMAGSDCGFGWLTRQWSLVGPTSVDEQDLAGDEAGPVRREERDRIGDVLWLAEPSQRHLMPEPVLLLRRVRIARLEEVGIDRARLDGVDADVRRQLARQMSGETVDAGLGRRVVRPPPPPTRAELDEMLTMAAPARKPLAGTSQGVAVVPSIGRHGSVGRTRPSMPC
jgi:hypothetical protein